jgi:hypothetical protein
MIPVVILAVAVYATLLVHFLARRSRAADAGPDYAGPPFSSRNTVPPCCAGNGLADPGASAWTALDDHQLTRLLKESSS